MAGRPAEFTFWSGILPQAVILINALRSLTCYGSHLGSRLSFVICQFLRTGLLIFDSFCSEKQDCSPSRCNSGYCACVQTDFVITQLLLMTLPNQTVDGKH